MRLTAARRGLRAGAAVLAGAALGLATALVRARTVFTGVHWETVAGLLVAQPLACIGLAWLQRRVPWRRAIGWVAFESAWLCAATFVGFLALSRLPARSGLFIESCVWASACVAGAALLIVWQRRHLRVAGPHCPACGYCLIGTPSGRCPECGRAFTPGELGMTAADLAAG